MLKVAICDDMPSERQILRRFLEGYFARTGFDASITEYQAGEPLTADYEDGDAGYGLLFLDIFMGAQDGIQTARKIRQYDTTVSIVFLTTTPDFALEGFEVFAMGYLLKPLVSQRAETLLERFLQEEYSGAQKFLPVRVGTQGARVRLRDILYLESQGNLLLIHTKNGLHRLYRTMAETEGLCGRDFLRCHQSFLVNLAQVDAADKTSFIMTDGSCVPIRQRDAKSLRERYFAYLLERAGP